MVSPIDIHSCYDAIYSAQGLVEQGLMDAKDFDEARIVLLQLARKYMKVLLEGKIRAEDID